MRWFIIERIRGQPAGFRTQQKECKCQMKKISVLIPCYNEQENVVPISEAVIGILTRELPQYDYELVFIDNDSTDNTRPLLRQLCAGNPKSKRSLTRGISASSILRITGSCRPPGTAPS